MSLPILLRTRIVASTFLAVVALLSIANAADVTWGGAQQISGVTDVSTTGNLIGAFNVAPGPSTPSTTINGVNFQGYDAPGGVGSAVSGGATFAMTPGGGGVFGTNNDGSSNAPFTSLPAVYQAMLNSYITPLFSPVTLTISGLIAGAQYQFQFWNNHSNDQFGYHTMATGGANSVDTRSNTGGANGGLGQWATGTFTAAASGMQQITFAGDGDGGFLNGFQLRQFVTTGVPETGTTFVLLGLGVGGLLVLQRRLGKSNTR